MSNIIVPENPFWKVFKRFGRDEIIAMIFNISGTAIIAYILANRPDISIAMKLFLISIAGPVIEKIGFYPAHLYQGYKEYIGTDKSLFKCLKFSLKNGSVSLIEDLFVAENIFLGRLPKNVMVYWLIGTNYIIIQKKL